MRIHNQDEILKPEVRRKIIAEINGPENLRRKAQAYKRHMILKDQVSMYVCEQLEKQFDANTVNEMSYSISNISFFRKVVQKLARVYANGCKRIAEDESMPEEMEKNEELNSTVEDLSEALNINQKMKIANEYLKAHRNCDIYLKPCPVQDTDKMTIMIQPLAPHLYDVVEDYYDRTKGMVWILSNYKHQDVSYSQGDAAREGRSVDSRTAKTPRNDSKDQIIADTPEDQDAELNRYIWWSDKYHFTTDETGEIIDKDGNVLRNVSIDMLKNPAETAPFVSLSLSQDNSYWAIGGDDLSDGSVLVNSLITHLNHIAVVQGYGQMYMKGKNVARSITVGPNKAVIMEYEEGDPIPEFGFANANPNLADFMKSIEMYVALLLTTNNLSTTGVSTQLNGTSAFPSGVAMMLDKSESMEDVNDQRQVFVDAEKIMWQKLARWLDVIPKDESIAEYSLPMDIEVKAIFPHQVIIQSETEKLNNIKLRKELGISTLEDLIKLDNPEMSDDNVKKKVLELAESRVKRLQQVIGGQNADQENPSDESAIDGGIGPERRNEGPLN